METFKIENDIPIPPPTGKGYTEAIRKLKIGQSVYFPGKTSAGMSSIAYHAGLQGKLTVRADSKGLRVWRIK